MVLNKQKGNMYPFVIATYNTIKGKCEHKCDYCYMNIYPLKPVRFDSNELKEDLYKYGEGLIFVGSSCDMWCWTISEEWIEKTLNHCKNFDSNTYLFQSKNPYRFTKFYGKFPSNTIFGTTIETNRHELALKHSEAPPTYERYCAIQEICKDDGGRVMVSIEPIMDFDLEEFLEWFYDIEPEFVSIGADSKKHNLIEPSKEKTQELIDELKTITEVKIKDNLKRILNYKE